MENRDSKLASKESINSLSSSSESSSSSEELIEKKEETPEQLQERIMLASIESKTTFSYEELEKQLINGSKPKLIIYDSDKVFSAMKIGAFIEFGYSLLSNEEKNNRDIITNVGWKVHLSINDSDKENLRRGYNIIKDIVIDERLTCKVVQPTADFYQDKDRNGRQITIYCAGDLERDWENILNRMENLLIQEGVDFTHVAPGDRPNQGSLIIGYRNDNNGEGECISAEDANYNYNYCNADDPLDAIDLSPPGVIFHSR
jgi:hypothetical protein